MEFLLKLLLAFFFGGGLTLLVGLPVCLFLIYRMWRQDGKPMAFLTYCRPAKWPEEKGMK